MHDEPESNDLRALEGRVRDELAWLEFPTREWVQARLTSNGEQLYDVLIVGGGQCGLATAFGLRRDRVTNVLVVDENEPGREGPWVTYARMPTLRTPKQVTGPDLGVAALTFHSWYEARYGNPAWQRLEKIAREDWMAYLEWYRQVLDLPVENGVRVERIEPRGDHFEVEVRRYGLTEYLYARTVVLATGIQGGGEWHVPEFISDALPRSSYAHSADQIDFERLRGKRVAVLGAGPSGFDNAQAALNGGADAVHLFFRTQTLSRVNPIRWMEQAGFLKHFPDLDDASKYAGIDHFLHFNQPPTDDSFARAASHPNFHLHPGCPWQRVEQHGDVVRVTTPEGVFEVDFVIACTGFVTDVRLRPELTAVADQIARWRDRYRPPASRANPAIDAHPYLGPHFELTERTPGEAPYLKRIFAFNYGALASLGLSGSAISGMKYSIRRLIDGVTGRLFLDDQEAILADYFAYDEPEFRAEYQALATSTR